MPKNHEWMIFLLFGFCLLFVGVLLPFFVVFVGLPGVFDSLPNVFRRCGGLAPLAGARQVFGLLQNYFLRAPKLE